jgi:hypothetical protein
MKNIKGLILKGQCRLANSIPGFRNIQKTRKLSSIEPDPGKKRLPVGQNISWKKDIKMPRSFVAVWWPGRMQDIQSSKSGWRRVN